MAGDRLQKCCSGDSATWQGWAWLRDAPGNTGSLQGKGTKGRLRGADSQGSWLKLWDGVQSGSGIFFLSFFFNSRRTLRLDKSMPC